MFLTMSCPSFYLAQKITNRIKMSFSASTLGLFQIGNFDIRYNFKCFEINLFSFPFGINSSFLVSDINMELYRPLL